MPILIEIVLALSLIGVAVSVLMRGRRVAERQEVLERRVEAYMLTIRRKASQTELGAMSDPELRDILLSSARNLQLQLERKWYALIGGGVVTVLAAITAGMQDGTRGFVIAVVVGAVVLYGLNEFLGRRIREPLSERGIDVERLRVE